MLAGMPWWKKKWVKQAEYDFLGRDQLYNISLASSKLSAYLSQLWVLWLIATPAKRFLALNFPGLPGDSPLGPYLL